MIIKEIKPKAIKGIPSRITEGKVYECFAYNISADGIKLLIADDEKKYLLVPAEYFEHYEGEDEKLEGSKEKQTKVNIKKSGNII